MSSNRNRLRIYFWPRDNTWRSHVLNLRKHEKKKKKRRLPAAGGLHNREHPPPLMWWVRGRRLVRGREKDGTPDPLLHLPSLGRAAFSWEHKVPRTLCCLWSYHDGRFLISVANHQTQGVTTFNTYKETHNADLLPMILARRTEA